MYIEMSSLKEWVSDHLHRLVGLSDGNTVDFVINLAAKAPSVGSLVENIHKNLGLSDGDKVDTFANDLYDKVPHISRDSRTVSNLPIKSGGEQRPSQYQWVDSDSDEDLDHRTVSKSKVMFRIT